MSKILVVYDSYFGNTEKIAQAIGKTLGEYVPVKRPGEVKIDEVRGLDYLIVGSPTRAFRPSDAIKAFMKSIPAGTLKGVKVTAFDTRMDPEKIGNPVLKFMAGVFGYAAEPIEKSLAKSGGISVGKPAGFIVLGSEGPLLEGELVKAAEWAKSLMA